MNEFLKTKAQIENSTFWLKENGYVSHPISAKDYELRLVTEEIEDGDLLDMGADGSRVLHNAIIKGIKGRKVGIDLSEATGDNKAEGAEYYKGDLMRTPFENDSFDTVVSLSTIEHDVDLELFAKEVSRLLRRKGKLIVSFDYWRQKVNTDGLKLYGLKWNILNDVDVLSLVYACNSYGLQLTGDINWNTEDAVISPSYCSPFPEISYTFGILEFKKQ